MRRCEQPGTLFGPALSKAKLAPGNQFIYDLITGQYSALVDLSTWIELVEINGDNGADG